MYWKQARRDEPLVCLSPASAADYLYEGLAQVLSELARLWKSSLLESQLQDISSDFEVK